MLHSGSRGPGNRIGTVYIELAKNDMMKLDKQVKVHDCMKVRQSGNLSVALAFHLNPECITVKPGEAYPSRSH